MGGYARVLRGGAWSFDAQYCRSAFRMGIRSHAAPYIGCRVCIAEAWSTEAGS
jgi:formylglycine-generating enzyme required for sulfatase activity